MIARVTVRLKQDVMDPQGNAVLHALGTLGHTEVRNIRVGRHFDVELDPAIPPARAQELLASLADQLLANPVIEDYEIELPGGRNP